jgi:signal transduction histidine kinase
MSTWNLERRLVAAAVLWLVVAWGLGGAALALVFREAVVARFDAKLQAVTDGLASSLARGEDGRLHPMRTHPNFRDPAAGWYWILELGDRRSTSIEASALADYPTPMPATVGQIAFSEGTGPNGLPVRAATLRLEPAGGAPVRLTVALDRRDIDQEIRSFTGLLIAAAVLLGVVLIAGVALQVRFGLAPLRRLRADLAEVEKGRLEAVPEAYPEDIRPVAEAINSVLERDRALTAWARKSAGNLAHALKTELARLRQLARERTDADDLVATTDRIAGIVDHHLSRATVGPGGHGLARADARAVVAAVVDGVRRIFAERALAIDVEVAGAPDFRGELQDLEEIVGNLVENACRHAAGRVRVAAHGVDNRLVLSVEDDGPGLDPEARRRATARGERLDEKGPGAGLGLAIVSDLAELYGGALELDVAPLGGLAARVELPAAARD